MKIFFWFSEMVAISVYLEKALFIKCINLRRLKSQHKFLSHYCLGGNSNISLLQLILVFGTKKHSI